MAEEACQHHFVIGAARPGRSTSWGMCQKCGDVREFKNSIYVDNVVYWAKTSPTKQDMDLTDGAEFDDHDFRTAEEFAF